MLGITLPTVRTGWKEWRATVKAVARHLATRWLEERSSLVLFRACAPTTVWSRR